MPNCHYAAIVIWTCDNPLNSFKTKENGQNVIIIAHFKKKMIRC